MSELLWYAHLNGAMKSATSMMRVFTKLTKHNISNGAQIMGLQSLGVSLPIHVLVIRDEDGMDTDACHFHSPHSNTENFTQL